MTVRPPLDVEAASRLANHVRLIDVLCVELSGRCVAPSTAASESALSWDLNDPTAMWALDEGELRILFPLVLTIDAQLAAKSSKQQPLAEFHVSYTLVYAAKELTSEQVDDLPHYVGISGFLHAWPYLRADIQCLSAKLGLPPLVLPVIVSGHAATRVSVSSANEPAKPRGLPPRRKVAKKKKS
jgi:hypothetical protein